MTIQKLGHCCLIIKHNGLTILTDPGDYTIDAHQQVQNIDLILITHDHPDHLHVDSLKEILKNNPKAKIITTSSVGKILDEQGIKHEIVEHGQSTNFKDVLIEAFGEKHAVIHSSIPQAQNTGYFIDNILFYPGDAFTNPGKKVKILALPVGGPWLKIGEAVDYALEISPEIAFPVHDAGLKSFGTAHRIPNVVLTPKGIKFVVIDENEVEL